MTKHEIAARLRTLSRAIREGRNDQPLSADELHYLADAVMAEPVEPEPIQKTTVATGPTDGEQSVLRYLNAAWTNFGELPFKRVTDCDEFRAGLHVLQNILARRLAARTNPDLWY